jgi:hypothetical protein
LSRATCSATRPNLDNRRLFLTGCRASAVTGACVGHLEADGVEHDLHVTENQNRRRPKIRLDDDPW